MTCKLSIVIAAYNIEDYIEECLKSVFSQKDIDQCEVIVTNDGSTDSTYQRIKTFKSMNDLNFRIINQSNLGVAVARNNAIENTKGEFIWVIDGDDVLEEFAITKLIDSTKLGLDAIKFGYSALVKHEETGNWYAHGTFGSLDRQQTISGGKFSNLIILGKIAPSAWSLVVRRSVLNDNNIAFKPYRNGEDLLWSHEVSHFTQNIKVLNESLYRYRQRPNSASYTVTEFHIASIFGVLKDLFHNLSYESEYLNFPILSMFQINKLTNQIISCNDTITFQQLHQHLHEYFQDKKIVHIHAVNSTPYMIKLYDELVRNLYDAEQFHSAAVLLKIFDIADFNSIDYTKFISKKSSFLMKSFNKFKINCFAFNNK